MKCPLMSGQITNIQSEEAFWYAMITLHTSPRFLTAQHRVDLEHRSLLDQEAVVVETSKPRRLSFELGIAIERRKVPRPKSTSMAWIRDRKSGASGNRFQRGLDCQTVRQSQHFSTRAAEADMTSEGSPLQKGEGIQGKLEYCLPILSLDGRRSYAMHRRMWSYINR